MINSDYWETVEYPELYVSVKGSKTCSFEPYCAYVDPDGSWRIGIYNSGGGFDESMSGEEDDFESAVKEILKEIRVIGEGLLDAVKAIETP